MLRIVKFELTSEMEIMMPCGATVLQANVQDNKIFVWAEVDDTETTRESRYFQVYATGHPIGDKSGRKRIYINTVLVASIAFQVFEDVPAQ